MKFNLYVQDGNSISIDKQCLTFAELAKEIPQFKAAQNIASSMSVGAVFEYTDMLYHIKIERV
mgnify:CR=1 FL=1